MRWLNTATASPSQKRVCDCFFGTRMQLVAVRKRFQNVRRRRGIHGLIDCVKYLDLSFRVTVNGRNCKLQRPPRSLGVKMRRGKRGRLAAATPGRFGGAAKQRSDPCIRMFPGALVRRGAVGLVTLCMCVCVWVCVCGCVVCW